MPNTKTTRAPSTDTTVHSAKAELIAELGDVTHTPESPILTPPNGHEIFDRGGSVVYDHTVGTTPSGQRCIVHLNPAPALTAKEAARLGRELIEVAKIAADERELRGFDE
jgi:hypothetical protein